MWIHSETRMWHDKNIQSVKEAIFKNNAPFIDFTLKINGVKIDNVEDLDVVMPMYNLLEYSKSYKKQQFMEVL